ncbi:sigma-54-dependent transcriptional regulator [Desulfoplanes sp.]
MSRLLIVDDDQEFLASLGSVLTHMGQDYVGKRSLAEGLDEVRQRPYDLVLLEVHLPDGNGLDEIKGFQMAPSGPEVVIITGYGDGQGAEVALRNGAWDYIEKPVSMTTLRTILKRSLDYRYKKRELLDHRTVRRERILGSSQQTLTSLEHMAKAARSKGNVIIMGETGTGKELYAKAIHENSDRKQGRLVVVDCTNLPRELRESLLFGHVKGAFTGAHESKEGLFKNADGGTVFLDEVGELALPLQKSMLRVLQEGRFRPVGSNTEVNSSFRVIAATNQHLQQMVEKGKFRKDLYFRLNAHCLHLYPLREREEDISVLARHYCGTICREYDIQTKTLSRELVRVMCRYPWPGNVRELINTLYACVDNGLIEKTLFPHHLPLDVRVAVAKSSFSGNGNGDSPCAEKPERNFTDPQVHIPELAPEELPTLKEVRNKTVSSLEVSYLNVLAKVSSGNVGKACSISGLSRARLYELFKKHDLNLRHGRAFI